MKLPKANAQGSQYNVEILNQDYCFPGLGMKDNKVQVSPLWPSVFFYREIFKEQFDLGFLMIVEQIAFSHSHLQFKFSFDVPMQT